MEKKGNNDPLKQLHRVIMYRIFIFLIVILMPMLSLAETIELKNGKIVEGMIVEETADLIKVDVGEGADVIYYKDELKDYKKWVDIKYHDGGFKDSEDESINQKEIKLPPVFTIGELTPEQRKHVEENYATIGVAKVDLSNKDKEIETRSPNAKELTDVAIKLFKQGRIQEAVTKAQEAIDQNRDYLPAYRVMADMLQESGSADQSIPLYDKILEKNPNDDAAYMNRGYAYGRLNQFSRAIEDYNKALELNPHDVNSISARAAAYVKTGEMSLAKKDYENLMNFDIGQACFGLGNIAVYYRNWREALSYYDKTVTASPNFAPAYLMKGQVFLQIDRKQEAIEAIKKAKSLGMTIPSNLEEVIQ